MALNLLILFIAGLSGIFMLFRPANWLQDNFKLAIAFAGGFLLSICLLHILPDLFHSQLGSFKVGSLVLAGFFLQQFLEHITYGAEHGHFHKHQNEHNHQLSFGVMILVGLTIHSFLEGTILSLPNADIDTSNRSLLAGIVLHKIPASLALSSVLVCTLKTRLSTIAFLTLFAVATPAGVVAGHYLQSGFGNSMVLWILLAIVCGNFLHISTTIVFESSPGHKFNFQRMLWSLLGTATAIVMQVLN